MKDKKNFAFSSLYVPASAVCHSDNRTDLFFSFEGNRSFFCFLFCIEMKPEIKFLNIFKEGEKRRRNLKKIR